MARSTDATNVDTAPSRPPSARAEADGTSGSLGDRTMPERGASGDERPEHDRLGVVGRLGRLESQADARDAGISGQLEQLAARLEVSQTSSMEVVGLLAGQVVARVDEIAATVDAALRAGSETLMAEMEATLGMYHEELMARVAAAQAATTVVVQRLLAEQADSRSLAEPTEPELEPREPELEPREPELEPREPELDEG